MISYFFVCDAYVLLIIRLPLRTALTRRAAANLEVSVTLGMAFFGPEIICPSFVGIPVDGAEYHPLLVTQSPLPILHMCMRHAHA